MPEKAPIGMRVLQKRLKDEKKQLEFATELSVCEKTIRNLEQSNATPSLKTLKRIAANMQKSVSSFLNLSQSLEADLYDNYVGGDLQDISAEIATLSRYFCASLEKHNRVFQSIPAFALIQSTD